MGEAAYGVVIFRNRKEVVRYGRGLGKRTNNEAEYEAVIGALLICSMAGLEEPILYSDSAVVVNQVSGKWKCSSDNLLPLLKSVREIQKDFKFRIIQVPREFVKAADKLANEFLNELELEKEVATLPIKKA